MLVWITSNLNGWALDQFDLSSKDTLDVIRVVLHRWHSGPSCEYTPGAFASLFGKIAWKHFPSLGTMMTVNSQLIGDGIGVIRCGMEWEWDTLAVFSMGHDPIIELEAWQDLACDRPMPGNRPLIWVVRKTPLTEAECPSTISALTRAIATISVLSDGVESRRLDEPERTDEG